MIEVAIILGFFVVGVVLGAFGHKYLENRLQQVTTAATTAATNAVNKT